MINLRQGRCGVFRDTCRSSTLAQIMLKIAGIGRDSSDRSRPSPSTNITQQRLHRPKSRLPAGKSQADTTFYINFDPAGPKAASGRRIRGRRSMIPRETALSPSSSGGEGTTPSTATDCHAGRRPRREKKYIKRLMLQDEGEYKDGKPDYSIYSPGQPRVLGRASSRGSISAPIRMNPIQQERHQGDRHALRHVARLLGTGGLRP